MYQRITAGLTLATAALTATAGHAATLGSGAYGASVKVGAVSTVSADAVIGQSSGATPGAYSQTGGVATINQGATLGSALGTNAFDTVSTGVVTTSATSNGTNFATANVKVANPSLGLGANTTVFGVTSLLASLGITADAISSTSTVSGVGGTLVGSGSSTIANLAFGGSLLQGLNLTGSLYSAAAPNTVVFSLAGLTLKLNEQIQTGNGIDTLMMQTNALHLSLDNYLLGASLLTGDVILGHSDARITAFSPAAVPEPASWAMMIGGFGMVGGALRARRRTSLSFA